MQFGLSFFLSFFFLPFFLFVFWSSMYILEPSCKEITYLCFYRNYNVSIEFQPTPCCLQLLKHHWNQSCPNHQKLDVVKTAGFPFVLLPYCSVDSMPRRWEGSPFLLSMCSGLWWLHAGLIFLLTYEGNPSVFTGGHFTSSWPPRVGGPMICYLLLFPRSLSGLWFSSAWLSVLLCITDALNIEIHRHKYPVVSLIYLMFLVGLRADTKNLMHILKKVTP